jgi:selenocysteine lyase/cysteine desulfurase
MGTDRRDFLHKISGVAALGCASALSESAGAGWIPVSVETPIASDLKSLRAQFPLLQEQVNGHGLIYLDSAATTQRPRAVIDAIANFYLQDNANPADSLHTLARRAATVYETSRSAVARFLNARGPEEIVWTRGTTEAINLVASSWGGANLRSGDEVVLTVSEHYSCLVPWQLAARRASARVRVLDVEDDGRLRLDQLDTLLSGRTKLVVFPHISNVLGFSGPSLL